MDALTEALLIFAARRDHLCQVIEPALARGDVVLCDRFTDATFAYQGAGRGFDTNLLSILERMAQTGVAPEPDLMREPDLTVWFDLAPEVAAERLAGARVPDRFESQPVEFFRRVAQGYADRAAARPSGLPASMPHRTATVFGSSSPACLCARVGCPSWCPRQEPSREQSAFQRVPALAPWIGAAHRLCSRNVATRGCCKALQAWGSTPWAWSWCAPGCARPPTPHGRAASAPVATPLGAHPCRICAC